MKINQLLLSFSLVLFGFWSLAQSADWNTYYGESKGFNIDYPESWILGAGDKSAGFQLITVFNDEPYQQCVITIRPNISTTLAYTSPSLKSLYKSHKKFKAKQGKKKDLNYQFIEEGTGETKGDTEYMYMDYHQDFVQDNGEIYQCTYRDVVVKFKPKGAIRNNIYVFQFISKQEMWDESVVAFDGMISSLNFYKE